jgi:hypothetical protein
LEGVAEPLRVTGSNIKVVYVHDDNLGSHSHYELLYPEFTDDLPVAPQMHADTDGAAEASPSRVTTLTLQRGDRKRNAHDWWKIDELPVIAALVPKPSKLRLPVEDLFHTTTVLRRLLGTAFDEWKGQLVFEPRFANGTKYRDSIHGYALNPSERRRFHEQLTLPRFVGVVGLFRVPGGVPSDRIHLVDVVLDVSEVARHAEKPPALALVCPGVRAKTGADVAMTALSQQLGCLYITA